MIICIILSAHCNQSTVGERHQRIDDTIKNSSQERATTYLMIYTLI